MFDVNKINVGDYIQTRDERVGYVSQVFPLFFHWKCTDGHTYVAPTDMKCFTQIGAYKFDEEEKKDKIDRLNYTSITMDNGLMYVKDKMWTDKINEIIDYLNKG